MQPQATCLFRPFAKSVMSRLLPLTLAQRAEMQVLINQGIDPIEARALVQSYVQKDAGFDEAKHPRDHGQFSASSGGSSADKATASSPHLREAARQHKDAQRASSRAEAARSAGDHARADRHLDESRKHLENAQAANQAHRESQPTTPVKPQQTPSNLVTEKHYANAEQSLARADRHLASAKEAKGKGEDAQATAHLQQANAANANARREVTLAASSHDANNVLRQKAGEAPLARDTARHDKLQAAHEQNRASIAAEKPRSGRDKASAASSQSTQAEHALGRAKAAAIMGDSKQAERHMADAKRSASAAEREVSGPLKGNAAEQNAQMQEKLRVAGVRAQTKSEVDPKRLDQARASQARAQAHDKASERHGMAGHTEQASHHATEAAHARHEAGNHLHEFGKLLSEAADHSLEKSAGVKKSSKSEALTRAYLKAFYQSAQSKLPKWQNSHLKRRAQASVDAPLKKGGLTLSQVHVPAPSQAASRPFKKPKVLPHIYVMKGSATEMAYINQALNLQAPVGRATEDADQLPKDATSSLEANRLVQGMDMEMANGGLTAQQARAAASRNLVEGPNCYDQVGASDAVLGDVGVMLDLGSGPSRAVGHIGIDVAPYDYGTVLWDLDLGIPFPDGCCRAVRMTHSLHPILDAYGEMRSPLALLLEVQRVLKIGGQFYYEGPEPLYEKGDLWPIPGLAIVSDSFNDALSPSGNAPVTQAFRRIPLAVPAFPGADARFAAAPPMAVDAAMALLALNASPAETAMANFVGKSAEVRHVPIVKADHEKQICYGEVLNPLTVDSQNDWLTPADIEKAAHNYMMTSRVIGSEHGDPIAASVVESFIAPQDLKFESPTGPVAVPKGTWLIGVKVTDPKEWALVKSGEYSGFSVGGFGVREFGMPDEASA